jgi:DNA-binding response OmpR family regulator
MALRDVAGWEVVAAESGAEAVVLASSDPPEAILLDVMMPDMDGPATLTALQASAVTCQVPVIFVTAQDGASDSDRLEALGAVGVIHKPFEIAHLADQVSGILGRAA